jgi:hypothetical protein
VTVQKRGDNGWQVAEGREPAGFDRVRRVYLRGAEYGPEVIDHLIELRYVEFIWLLCTRLTEDDVQRLRETLPNCEIHWDGRSFPD